MRIIEGTSKQQYIEGSCAPRLFESYDPYQNLVLLNGGAGVSNEARCRMDDRKRNMASREGQLTRAKKGRAIACAVGLLFICALIV